MIILTKDFTKSIEITRVDLNNINEIEKTEFITITYDDILKAIEENNFGTKIKEISIWETIYINFYHKYFKNFERRDDLNMQVGHYAFQINPRFDNAELCFHIFVTVIDDNGNEVKKVMPFLKTTSF